MDRRQKARELATTTEMPRLRRCFERLPAATSYCASCGRDLEDEKSRAMGIGPECRKTLSPERAAMLESDAVLALAALGQTDENAQEVCRRVTLSARRRVSRELSIAAGLAQSKGGRLVWPSAREREDARRRVNGYRRAAGLPPLEW